MTIEQHKNKNNISCFSHKTPKRPNNIIGENIETVNIFTDKQFTSIMNFNTITFLFPLFTTLLSINSIQVEAGGMQYQFHKDAAGQDNCEKARDDQEELETFKLYCVNKVQSFQLCSLTCSDALHFEGSVGDCRDYECLL
jgi:hypothetical protein